MDTTALVEGTVLVEFPDGDRVASWTVQGVGGLDHLSEITVAGVLSQDDAGNLTLRASAVHLLE